MLFSEEIRGTSEQETNLFVIINIIDNSYLFCYVGAITIRPLLTLFKESKFISRGLTPNPQIRAEMLLDGNFVRIERIDILYNGEF